MLVRRKLGAKGTTTNIYVDGFLGSPPTQYSQCWRKTAVPKRTEDLANVPSSTARLSNPACVPAEHPGALSSTSDLQLLELGIIDETVALLQSWDDLARSPLAGRPRGAFLANDKWPTCSRQVEGLDKAEHENPRHKR